MFKQSGKLCSSILHQLAFSRPAGHSKWANIKHIKAAKDKEKSNIFAKFARMIRIAIQEGGSPNPQMNSYLRTTIDQALSKNMPMSTIEKNIKKFNSNEAKLTRHFFEIRTMSFVFVICEVYTENLPGLKQNLNTVLRKAGNNTSLADIVHNFQEVGYVQVTCSAAKNFANESEFEDTLTEHAIEIDAQEVENIDFENKTATFICRPIDIEKCKRSLLNLGYVVEDSQHIFVPKASLKLNEAEMQAYENLKLKLSQLDGYENVFDNVESNEATS